MSKILVIEDELAINKMICMNLGITGYETMPIYDGESALELINNGDHFDLALVDVMLPKMSGFELLQPLMDRKIPVIYLTAKGDIESKLKGLTSGAEDYIIKPFEMLELLARIEKVLKRYCKAEMILYISDIEINISGRSVKRKDEAVQLTPIEFDLLLLLAKNKNIALTRDKLLAEVWNINYQGETRTVDVHIAQIRKKTGLDIVSVPKYGYRLEEIE